MKKTIIFFATLLLCLQIGHAQIPVGAELFGVSNGIQFGSSVSISDDGSRIAVGAELFLSDNFAVIGSVQIFDFENGGWVQVGEDILGTEDFDFIGHAVSFSADGNVIAISGTGNSNAPVPGKVKVYQLNGSIWQQIGNDILGEEIGDYFGYDIALSADGKTFVAGAIKNNEDTGYTQVHTFENGTWVQIGDNISGDDEGDFSGSTVDISADGQRIAIGATNANGDFSSSGVVKIFDREGDSWTQIGSTISGEALADLFGSGLSLSDNGSRIAIGSINNDGTADFLGEVKVFEWMNEEWQQMGTDLEGTNAGSWFGSSVSLSSNGERLVVGAPLSDEDFTDAGQVKIYDWTGTNWTQVGISIEGEQEMDWTGVATDISADGRFIVVAERNFVSVGQDEGSVRVYDLGNINNLENNVISRDIHIYPNPASTEIFIDGIEFSRLLIYDAYGRLQKDMNNRTNKVELSELEAGMYSLVIIHDDFRTALKFVVL